MDIQIKATHLVKQRNKQGNQQNQDDMMHARPICSSPKQLPKLGIRGQLVAQYVLSLYILAILTIILT